MNKGMRMKNQATATKAHHGGVTGGRRHGVKMFEAMTVMVEPTAQMES